MTRNWRDVIHGIIRNNVNNNAIMYIYIYIVGTQAYDYDDGTSP